MRKFLRLQFLLCWLPSFLYAQSPADTLYRYPDGGFLLKIPARYEFRDSKGLIEWWEQMDNYLTINYKSYHLVKRKDGEKWKTGLFRRNEGKLFLRPEYEQVFEFFGSSRLVLVKNDNGLFIYSVDNGKRTREGFQTFRRFGNRDCLAFNENGMFIYGEDLALRDSIMGTYQPAMQLENAKNQYLFLTSKQGNLLVDDQYRSSYHPDWKDIVRLTGDLMVVECASGHGVYHLGQSRLVASCDHEPYLYELHEARFMLFKEGNYILYDSTGKTLAKARADGMMSVQNLRAFFYRQDGYWGIMNSAGNILKEPVFDHFDQSGAPVGQFIARSKGETMMNRYGWVYTEAKGERTITGIKLLGPYRENEPAPKWPPDQPVDEKNN